MTTEYKSGETVTKTYFDIQLTEEGHKKLQELTDMFRSGNGDEELKRLRSEFPEARWGSLDELMAAYRALRTSDGSNGAKYYKRESITVTYNPIQKPIEERGKNRKFKMHRMNFGRKKGNR